MLISNKVFSIILTKSLHLGSWILGKNNFLNNVCTCKLLSFYYVTRVLNKRPGSLCLACGQGHLLPSCQTPVPHGSMFTIQQSEPAGCGEGPRGLPLPACQSWVSPHHRHPLWYPMVPHLPSCAWSLRAGERDKEVCLLPVYQSQVPPHHSFPWFPIGHLTTRACGLVGGTEWWSMHLLSTGWSVVLVVMLLWLLVSYYIG